MVHFNIGHHHLHLRKRVHLKEEKFPNPDKWKRFLDRAMYPVGLAGPFMMIPQILNIYINKDATSIVLSTWLLFLGPASLWIAYGFSHKEKVIIASNIAWVTGYILMILGAILY